MALVENPSFYGGDTDGSDIFQILNTKDYLPSEDDLPKSTVLKYDGMLLDFLHRKTNFISFLIHKYTCFKTNFEDVLNRFLFYLKKYVPELYMIRNVSINNK